MLQYISLSVSLVSVDKVRYGDDMLRWRGR